MSVGLSVGPSVRPSHFTFFAFLSSLKAEKFRYEYFTDVSAPAQLITAPARPPATGAVVYTALFFCHLRCHKQAVDVIVLYKAIFVEVAVARKMCALGISVTIFAGWFKT